MRSELVSPRALRPFAAAGDMFQVRPARPADRQGLIRLARQTDGTITGISDDEKQVGTKLDYSEASLGRQADPPSGQEFLLVLEEVATGTVVGMAKVASTPTAQPPYRYAYRFAYRLGIRTLNSAATGASLAHRVLRPTQELDGVSEVGALFVAPAIRARHLGRLLARSRYLFMLQHRRCFADRVMSDMRGRHYAVGRSAFWDALGQHWSGMTFLEADTFNTRHGSQFISELFPQTAVPTALLPPEAAAVVGVPHETGEAAFHLLQQEGFRFSGLVNIFDAGPIGVAWTDELACIKAARRSPIMVDDAAAQPGESRMVAAHSGASFRLIRAEARFHEDGTLAVPAAAASILNVRTGDEVLHAPF